MYSRLLTIRRIGIVAVLSVCVALPGVTWAKGKDDDRKGNHGQPFAEILAQIAMLNDKLNDLLAKEDVDLRGVTQNWDKKLVATNGEADGCNSDRFTCVLDGAAVRDNETGLVWERSPDTNTRSWAFAIIHCANREVDGRKGFQLPMREQLATLLDMDANPALPTGHPFQNLDNPQNYWSATTNTNNPTDAWAVRFSDGLVNPFLNKSRDIFGHTWCARGRQNYDGQDVLNVLEALPVP